MLCDQRLQGETPKDLTLFQIDAFASRPFEGNPAAVCPLEEWLDDGVMQAIAAENNLSETAFFAHRVGIDEDPVTSSAYTELAPYWARELGKSGLCTRQVSPRGEEVRWMLTGDRVRIGGQAVKCLAGTISVPGDRSVWTQWLSASSRPASDPSSASPAGFENPPRG